MITTNNNKICFNEKEIILKGASIPDIYWLIEIEKQDLKKTILKIKELGFNTVRVPVLPGHISYYENYIDTIIKKVVRLCKENNLLCILDWHAIGNPLHNETRLKKYFHIKKGKKIYWYLADLDLAKKGLKLLSELFGKENHVIFELFNEPCPKEKEIPELNLSPLPIQEWIKIAKDLISIIRANSNNLILVSSNYWSFNLKDISESTIINLKNIAYSFHCYPFKNNRNWKDMLNSVKDYPIVITEFGYDLDESSKYKSSFKEYLYPLIEYVELHKISWIGWCFSASWRPRLISKWDEFELSDCGKELVKRI